MDEYRPSQENNDNGKLSRTTIAIISVLGLIIIGTIFSVSYYSDREVQKTAAQTSERIEKGVIVGVDKTDPVVSVNYRKISGKDVYSAISEAGRAVIFDQDWKTLAEADNPPVDLNKELPKSISALAPLDASNLFLGGTLNGKLNLYRVQNFKLVPVKEITDFRNPKIGDPVAGSGSVTAILMNDSRSKALVMNYDGLGRIYSIEGDSLRETGSIQLSAAAIEGDFVGQDEFWIVTADGNIYVFNVNNPVNPGMEFNVSDFGRIAGADYRDGKFLIYGHSLEVKTASITIYNRLGKYEQTLTQKSVSEERPFDKNSLENSAVREMPDISDLGESFEDAEWINAEQVLAVKNNKVYLLDISDKKIRTFDLPLELRERAVRFRQTGKNIFAIGTSNGRVFETKLELIN